MNLIIHQLRKDLLRTRWLILLWFSILVLRFGLVGANNDPSDNAWQITYQLLTVLTTLLDSLLVLVIVPLVIQQEPLLGTTAFWLTRPLSRPTLFASKALFVSVLLVLPVVVQTIVLLANGVTLREVALSIPWLLITQLSWIVSVAVLAVLTPSFGRFAIAMVIYFIILFVLTYIFQIARIFGNVNAFTAIAPSLTGSRGLVSALWAIALGAIVLFAQYLWRKPSLAWTFAVMALLGPIFIGQFWSWNFLQPPVNFVHDDAIVPADLTLGLEKHVFVFDSVSFRGGVPRKGVQGTIDFGGITGAGTIKISQLDSSIKTAAGVPVPTQSSQSSFFSTMPDRSALEAALGVPLIDSSTARGGQQQMQLFTLENADYLKVREQPLQYDATAHGIIYRYVSTTELPLQKGAEFRRGSYRLTLTGILHQPDGVDITAREQDVQLPLSLRSDQDVSQSSLGRSGFVAYALVNRKLGQAVMEKQNNFGGIYRIFSSAGNPLIHAPLTISFGPENNGINWSVPIDETWLKDAVLVRLKMVPVAPFTKTFSYSGLYLDENSVEMRARLTAEVAPPPIADLNKIVLPPNADRKQVSDYISAILDASRQQNRFSDSDPEIQMLEQVGAENVDLLIEAGAENHNYYLNHAINDLAQPDQEKLVLRALANNHDLMNTVMAHHWEQDAKPLLVAALPTAVNSLPNRWIDTVASFHDPATYPALRDYYVGHPHRAAYEALKKIPDFDLHGAVDAAWKLIDDPTRAWATRNLLEPAATIGEPDFPDVAMRLLEKGNEYDHQFASKALRAFTPATGATDADLLNWMKANRANLVFEPASKKFVLRAPASAITFPAPEPSTNVPPQAPAQPASAPPSSLPPSAAHAVDPTLPAMIDLKPFYTQAFLPDGSDSMFHGYAGRKTIDGLPFDISGKIQLFGKENANRNKDYAGAVSGIKIGRKFDELHLIHAVEWREYYGCPVVMLRLHYADDTSYDFPIRFDFQVNDWNRLFTEDAEIIADPDTKIIWRGAGAAEGTGRLFKSVLRNPFPEKQVDSMDLISTRSGCTYVLAAATVADSDPTRPVTPPMPLLPRRNFDGTLNVHVIDGKTGAPVVGAEVYPAMIIGDISLVADNVLTGLDGIAPVKYPRDNARDLRVKVAKRGYLTNEDKWGKGWDAGSIPPEVTFQLAAGRDPILDARRVVGHLSPQTPAQPASTPPPSTPPPATTPPPTH